MSQPSREPTPPGQRRPAALPGFAVAVVLVMVLVLAAGSALTVRITGSLNMLRSMTVEAEAVTDAAQALQMALGDAEVAVSDYLVTARPVYLRAYRAAMERQAVSMAQLADKARQQPWLQIDYGELTSLTAIKLSELQQVLGAAQASGPEAGRALALSQDAVTSMTMLRAAIGRITQRADTERDDRSAAAQTREHAVMLGVLLLATGSVLLLGTAALGLLAGRSRLLQAQADTRAQGARWQATVEALPEGVAVFDANDTLLLWNRSLWPVGGFPANLELAGTPFSQFAAAVAGWTPAALDGPSPRQHAAVEVRSGDRILTVARSPMPGGGQMLVVGDATRRVHAEAIARQAQKMEVLGQLTGGVAHDFNNLLQAVSANLELMSARLPPDGWIRERLAAAAEGIARGARLTQHLLAFARRQPLAPASVDTLALMRGLDDLLRRTVGQSVTLEMQLAPDVWPLTADSHQLENAILNLAINGRDAMVTSVGPGSPAVCRLTLSAANASLAAPAAEAFGVAPGDYVAITIADTGCGMSPEQLARAIEPFYTTKPEGQGTGLGLPMAYGFAQQSGGHLRLASVVGQGTEATLFVPRASAPPAATALPAADTLAEGAGELILLVEDEAAIRAAAMLSLQDLGYTVAEADCPDAAWRLLQDGLRPALLFSDVLMPGTLTALDLAARAEGLMPGLPVLFTSGYPADALAASSGSLPAILPKPWTVAELARRIRLCLDDAGAIPRRRILLVEDDVLIRTVTTDMLEQLGHDVVQAADAATALERLDGTQLLVTDLGLGGMDGLALATAARQRIPGLPVVIATGQAIPAPGRQDGMVWLAKPFNGKALRGAMRRAVQSQTVTSGAQGIAAPVG